MDRGGHAVHEHDWRAGGEVGRDDGEAFRSRGCRRTTASHHHPEGEGANANGGGEAGSSCVHGSMTIPQAGTVSLAEVAAVMAAHHEEDNSFSHQT